MHKYKTDVFTALQASLDGKSPFREMRGKVYGGPQRCESPETQGRAGPKAKAAGGTCRASP